MKKNSDLKEQKNKITLAIKKHIIPELRVNGFSGTFPHFRKKENKTLQFVSFQFGRSSLEGKFVIELGLVSKQDLPDWAKSLPEEKLNYGLSRYRHRLGAKSKGEDGVWFDFQSPQNEEEFDEIALKAREIFADEYPIFLQTYLN